MKFELRNVLPDDVEDIHDVHIRSMRSIRDPVNDSPDTQKWIDERSPADLRAEMDRQYFVVAENEGRIIGFAALALPDQEIKSVFVDPRAMRLGVGRAMVSELERVARRKGLHGVRLMATGTAIGFYRRIGYRTVRGSDKPAWAEMRKDWQ